MKPQRLVKNDVEIDDALGSQAYGRPFVVQDRLAFDGYRITWFSTANQVFDAFSGLPQENARESEKDLGPTPQGLYALDPKTVQVLEPSEAWGRWRVPLQPYRATVNRMIDCFGVIRTQMYVHGGGALGTIGCVEINDDAQEEAFFSRLRAISGKIELEVRYVDDRRIKYEDPRCPYG